MDSLLTDTSQKILVIGYGSDLRSDDAVGKTIADIVATWQLPKVETLTLHQLTPELAAILVTVELVIFVDAYPALAGQTVQVCPLKLAESRIPTGHWCEPSVLLAIAQSLYDYHPQGWWVKVPGVNFELGDRLSPIAEQEIKVALQEIEHLIKTARRKPCTKLE